MCLGLSRCTPGLAVPVSACVGAVILAQLPPAEAALCEPGQSPELHFLGNFLVEGQGWRGGAGGQSGAAGTGPAVVGTDAWLWGRMRGYGAAVGWQGGKLSPLQEPKLTPAWFIFLGRGLPGAGAAPLGTRLLDGPGACVAFPFLLQPGGEGSPRFSLSSVSPLSPSQPLEDPCSVHSPLNPPISGSELSLVPGAGHCAGLCATASAGAGERRRGLDRARAGSLAPGCVSMNVLCLLALLSTGAWRGGCVSVLGAVVLLSPPPALPWHALPAFDTPVCAHKGKGGAGEKGINQLRVSTGKNTA